MKVYVITQLFCGLASEYEPIVCKTSKTALKEFSEIVSDDDYGFRKPKRGETLDKYLADWYEYDETDSYNKDDFEVHIFEVELLD